MNQREPYINHNHISGFITGFILGMVFGVLINYTTNILAGSYPWSKILRLF